MDTHTRTSLHVYADEEQANVVFAQQEIIHVYAGKNQIEVYCTTLV